MNRVELFIAGSLKPQQRSAAESRVHDVRPEELHVYFPRVFYSVCFTISEADLQTLKENTLQKIKDNVDLISASNPEEVAYVMSLDLYPLLSSQ